jgi:hypothetical protein
VQKRLLKNCMKRMKLANTLKKREKNRKIS